MANTGKQMNAFTYVKGKYELDFVMTRILKLNMITFL